MKSASAGVRAHFSFLSQLTAAALLGLGLSACGGGGGGGGGFMPLPSQPPSAPPSKPSTPEAPQPTPEDLALKPGAEIPPSLSAPQAGSMALEGRIGEGIYRGSTGAVVSTLVDYTYFMAHRASDTDAGTIWGSLQVTGNTWTFDATAMQLADARTGFVTGSGLFGDKLLMSGTFSNANYHGGRTQLLGPLHYSRANALAVTQDTVAGEWTNRPLLEAIGVRISVAADGSFSGETEGSDVGVCHLTGTLPLLEAAAGSVKNMYGVVFWATDAAQAGQSSCKLDTGAPYLGRTAIDFLSAGQYPSNGAYRYLFLLAMTSNGAWLNVQLFKPEVTLALSSN